jgi:hypothetical protein
MTDPASAAVPPRGPGVVPPFAAPPSEGRGSRMWLGLGVAGLALVLCCGGGLAAVVGLLIAGTRAIDEQAEIVITDYLEAVAADEYGEAYDLLCPALQARESLAAFQRRVETEPEISSFEVGSTDMTSSTDIVVPVQVRYATGGTDSLRFVMAQDSRTGGLLVCGDGE